MFTRLSVGAQEVLAIAQDSTNYSNILTFDNCYGFAGMEVTVSAGSVTISQQCALVDDNNNFRDPVDESNIAIGQVVTAMAVGSRYVQYDPVFAPFIRFKVIEVDVASATVTFTPFFVEDR